MDTAPAILQYRDCVVKPVKPIRLYFDDLSLHTGRHHAFMGDNGSLRQGGVNLPGGEPVPGLTGQSDIPFLLIVQKRYSGALRDKGAVCGLQRFQRAFDAVENIIQDTRPQQDIHRRAGTVNRFAGAQAGGFLVDLDGGDLIGNLNDLADQAAVAHVNLLHHGEAAGILNRDNRAVDSENYILVHSSKSSPNIAGKRKRPFPDGQLNYG